MKRILFCVTVLMLNTSVLAEPRLQCSDFKNQPVAQKFYDKLKASGDKGWKSLDRDGDGRACDCLPGGNGTNCPKPKD